MNIQRWVWLEVAVLPANKKPKANPVFNRHYIPEDIASCIPNYKAQLQKVTSTKSDDEPVIRDDRACDPQVVTKAIRFLASGYLTPLDASSGDCKITLDNLVELWHFGVNRSIKGLCTAVIAHIELSTALTLGVFLAFARRFYDNFGNVYVKVQDTGLGRMIKRRLAYFLPRLQESMTVDEISSEAGILGKQLITVLLEDRIEKHEAPVTKAKIEVKVDWVDGEC